MSGIGIGTIIDIDRTNYSGHKVLLSLFTRLWREPVRIV
nr:MAG TPA: hypothetical protein [Caudoviricetes sp.]